jgi:hypothetical protein
MMSTGTGVRLPMVRAPVRVRSGAPEDDSGAADRMRRGEAVLQPRDMDQARLQVPELIHGALQGSDLRLERGLLIAELRELLALPDGPFGYDDGDARSATFHSPMGIAVDVSGNVYVADTANNAIRKISPDGYVSTLAGGKAAYAAIKDKGPIQGRDPGGFADDQGSEAQFRTPRETHQCS